VTDGQTDRQTNKRTRPVMRLIRTAHVNYVGCIVVEADHSMAMRETRSYGSDDDDLMTVSL